MFDIQRAVVTGGSSGIGKAMVDQLLRDGCEVFSLSRTVLPREAFAEQGTLHQLACDITEAASVDAAFRRIGEKTGAFDVLFSNAGFGISGAVADTPREDIKRQFDVNVVSAADVVRHSIPFLSVNGGRIVFTSSVAAVVSIPFQSFYSATKASVNMLALALDNELKPFGIRTIAVMPGDVKTAFTERRVKAHSSQDSMFIERTERAVGKMEHDEQTGISPSVIAGKMIRIAQKHRPKPLYGLNASYRLVLLLFKWLPCRLTNWAVGKLYIG